jgi:hypothetical protein
MIYPSSGTIMKCFKSYDKFQYGKTYMVKDWIGRSEEINGKRYDYRTLFSLYDNGVAFRVTVDRLNLLYDKGYLRDEKTKTKKV